MSANGPNPEPQKRPPSVQDGSQPKEDWIIFQTITAQRILPVCCACGKIRDPKGAWRSIDRRTLDNFTGDMTHTYCPECIKEHFPDYWKRIDPDRQQSTD